MDVLVATDFFTAEVWTWCGLVTYYMGAFPVFKARTRPCMLGVKAQFRLNTLGM
jgi:hypothetical protein